MLKSTAARFCEFLNKAPNQIPIALLEDERERFRLYLEERKYRRKSVRSYGNYLNILLRKAREFGWTPVSSEVPKAWQAIMEIATEAGCASIVRYAIKSGKTPLGFCEDDVQKWYVVEVQRGLALQYVVKQAGEFRTAVVKAGLAEQLPRLKYRKDPYGISLKKFPEKLRNEVEALLEWKQNDFVAGRPRKAKNRPISALNLEKIICALYGYSQKILHLESVDSLARLAGQDVVTSYAGWAISRRKVTARTVKTRIVLLRAALRHHPAYKSLPLDWFDELVNSLPLESDPDVSTRKDGKYLPYGVVNAIAEKIRAERGRAAQYSRKRLALTVRDELIMLWLVVLPWRQKNIRDCRIGGDNPNLFKAPISPYSSLEKMPWVVEAEKNNAASEFWQFRFSAEETKAKRPVHALLPLDLIEPLEEYLSEYRPDLLQDGDPGTLFLNSEGGTLDSQEFNRLVSHRTMKHGGKRVNPHLFRDIFAYEWLRHHPEGYLTLSKALWHRDIKVTLQYYCRQFDESNAVAQVDAWRQSLRVAA